MSRFPVNLAAQPIEKVRAARRAVAYTAAAAVIVSLVHLAFLGWGTGGRSVPQATSQAPIDASTLAEWQLEVDRLAAEYIWYLSREVTPSQALGHQHR